MSEENAIVTTVKYPFTTGITGGTVSPSEFDYSYESVEELFAIYKTNDDLPPAVKNNLPEHAQTIWRNAFNSALEQYGTDKAAARVAWSAVKKAGYAKKGDKWVKVSSEKEGDDLVEETVDAATPAQIVHKSPPKGYPKSKSQYADPKRYKYPLDTYQHARAALAYWSKKKNRAGYSPEEQRTIWSRILRACKKFGIKVSKTQRASAESLDASTEEESVPAEWIVAGKIYEDGEKRIVEAVPFDSGVNKNGWALSEDAMRKMLQDSIGKPVYWSHTDDPMCRDEPIGKIVDLVPAGLDIKDDHIKLEIIDEEAISKIDSGQWDNIGVSIGAKAPIDKILCSECGKPFYECTEHPNAHKVVSDGFVDHWAVVRNPAFENAGFVDFLSSLNAAIEAKGADSEEDEDEELYIEIDPNTDLITELLKEGENEMTEEKTEAETASVSFEDLKENPEVKKLIEERDSLKAEIEKLKEKVTAYEKAEIDSIVAEIKTVDPEANEEELSAMGKETLTKLLEATKRIAAKAEEKVKAEMDSSNPVRPDVADEDNSGKNVPTKEEIEKAYAKEKMGIDIDAFLKMYGKKE